MAERIAIYKVMQERRRHLGRPIRRESVRTQVVLDQEIMTLVYSARYTEPGMKPWRVYRVCVTTLTGGVISDTIMHQGRER